MLTTLIFIGILILGLVLCYIGEKKWKDGFLLPGSLGVILGSMGVIVAILYITFAHVGVNNTIKRDNFQYESLCYRLEIANSDYEDLSRLEIIKDITEWNDNAIEYKYWAENPWSNWFYSRKRADNLKIIDY